MPPIEDDIIKNLTAADPSLADAAPNTDDTNDEATTQAPSTTAQPAPSGTPDPTGGSKPDASRSSQQDGATKPPVTKAGSRPDGATAQQDGSLKLADGTIIAKGAPRRLYEEAATLRTENEGVKAQNVQLGNALRHIRDAVAPDYDRRIASLTAEVNTYKAAATLPNQYQLTPDEHTYAVKMIAAYKTNPIETLKFMLAEAKAQGHSIEGIGAGVDTAAIQRMIEDRLAPFTQDRAALTREQEVQTNAANETAAFLNTYPDAATHAEHIAGLMEQYPDLSPERAYYELKLECTKRGLDWSKPILAQLQALQQNGGSAQPGSTQVTGPALPNGRTNAAAPHVTEKSNTVARADTSMSDIVREAMRESGMLRT